MLPLGAMGQHLSLMHRSLAPGLTQTLNSDPANGETNAHTSRGIAQDSESARHSGSQGKSECLHCSGGVERGQGLDCICRYSEDCHGKGIRLFLSCYFRVHN